MIIGCQCPYCQKWFETEVPEDEISVFLSDPGGQFYTTCSECGRLLNATSAVLANLESQTLAD